MTSYKNYEITSTNFRHPDIKSGQHTNGPATYWVRWRVGPWLCTGKKQAYKVRMLIDKYGARYAAMLARTDDDDETLTAVD